MKYYALNNILYLLKIIYVFYIRNISTCKNNFSFSIDFSLCYIPTIYLELKIFKF